MSDDKTPEYFSNMSAPELFASGLQEVEVMGPNARFILYIDRRNGSTPFRETALSFIVPVEAVAPGIALTLRRLPSGVLIPAVGQVARHFMLH